MTKSTQSFVGVLEVFLRKCFFAHSTENDANVIFRQNLDLLEVLFLKLMFVGDDLSKNLETASIFIIYELNFRVKKFLDQFKRKG